MMEIPVFISCAKAFQSEQEAFLSSVEDHLRSCDLRPMTLGRSEYSLDAPLKAIRRLMSGSFGLLTLAFRRTHLEAATDRPDSDLGQASTSKSGKWLTSPYCQIEPAMAYQIGLPILIWRESGVIDDGLLDRGAVGLSMPEFDLSKPPMLSDRQWRQPIDDWVQRVRGAHTKAGDAPRMW